MKKFKISIFILAIAIALTGSFAFKPAGKPAGKFTTYIYTSTSDELADMQNTANWEGVETPESCGEYGTIPCVFNYEGEESFHDYLGSFTDPVVLKNAAYSRRTPE